MHARAKFLALSAAVLLATTAAHAVPATGVLGGTTLFDFDTAAAGVTNQRAVTGLSGVLVSIDYRPATGALYGLTNTGGLYTINLVTGAATFASALNVSLSGGTFDIAFNPTVDRLRIVSDNGQNLRVNVDTGITTVDTALNRGGTVATGIVAAAYTNQVAGATSTTLYDLDSSGTGSLETQAPPNNGTLNRVGSTSMPGLVSFDIDGTTGVAYVASSSAFGTIDLATGTVTSTGTFGRDGVTDFSIAPVSVPEPFSLALLGTGLIGAALVRRKARAAR